MEISRNNYEIFFLDYLDGKLEGKEIDRFLDFIEQNPDLKKELAGIENLKLPAEKVSFSNKNLLHKTDKQKTEDFTAVAYMEGDLSELDRKLFLKHLDFHPEQTKELNLLLKTRLQPDETIVFPAKKKLYRRDFPKQLIYWGSRVAAVLFIAFVSWAVFNFEHWERMVSQPENLVLKNSEPVIAGKILPEVKQETAKVEVPEKAEAPVSAAKEKTNKGVVPKAADSKPVQEIIVREPEIVEPIRPVSGQLISVETVSENVLIAARVPAQEEKSTTEYYTVNSYLAEKVLKIKKSDRGEGKSLIESGLDLAGEVSGNRIRYETEEGKISRIRFDSRLLAFSIPVKN